ncbi:hypothetical protein CEXT_251801, partial [Caerostris extrusa]
MNTVNSLFSKPEVYGHPVFCEISSCQEVNESVY